MKQIFNINGLPFFEENEITQRLFFQSQILNCVKNELLKSNRSWKFYQIEAPILTPKIFINSNYTNNDIFVQENLSSDELVLRPETTPGSYEYAKYLLSSYVESPPFVVWQYGKSFRREQDQPSKHCRFKEFYQQEFQCFFTEGTKNDYHFLIQEPIRKCLESLLKKPCRIVESDRLPDYSQKTMDIEIDNGDKWMELCSISLRTDFDMPFVLKDKKLKIFVVEVAVGLDRMIYNYSI